METVPQPPQTTTSKVPRLICIVSPRTLDSELLAYALEREGGEGCTIVPDVSVLRDELADEARRAGGSPRAKRLILIDCVENDFDRVTKEIAEPLRSPSQDLVAAIYNVYPGWGIEEEALRLGIKGFFYKQDSLKLFTKGVRSLFDQEVWVSREILLRGVVGGRRMKRTLLQEKTGLSTREIEILLLLGSGAQNDEIAQKLCISPNTVKTHLYNVFKKIDVPNRLQAALWVAKNL
jgi:LuxR family transcriptional regulator, positive regulator of biofilm formation